MDDFIVISTQYVSTVSTVNGAFGDIELSFTLEGYGSFAKPLLNSEYSVLNLPDRLPNVAKPVLRMDVDNKPPVFWESYMGLPSALTLKSSMQVVTGPSYYVR